MLEMIKKEDLDMYSKLKSQICNRVGYVVEKIVEACGFEGERDDWTWYFEGGKSGSYGEINVYKTSFKVEIDGVFGNEDFNYLINIYNFNIPFDYVFNKNFEKILEKDIKDFLERKSLEDKEKKLEEKNLKD